MSENKYTAILKEKLIRNSWPTPFYFYDLIQVVANYQSLQNALSSRFSIYYSMKSNPHKSILKKLKEAGCLIDVSSKAEALKAFEAGFTPDKISFVGPGKSREELSMCIDYNIEYTVIESSRELKIFAELAKEKSKNAKFVLRVNPDKFVHISGQVKSNNPSHFGIDESEILSLKDFITKNPQIKFAGLHFYLQSQYLKSESIVSNFRYFVESTLKLQAHFNLQFEMLNLGGGFGIAYFEGQDNLNMEILSQEIQKLLREENTLKLKDLKFFIESGRFISGSSGTFVTQVQYIKKSHGKTFVICDGGMTQHQSAIGVGQVIRRHFPIEVMTMKPASTGPVTIAGPSCYSIDIMGADVTLPVPSEGDYILIGQSGAYGKTFSPENFLSRPAAGEYTNEDL